MRTSPFNLIAYRSLVAVLLASSVTCLAAQDTLYLGPTRDTVRTMAECDHYTVMVLDPEAQGRTLAVEHDRTGRVLSEERYVTDEEEKRIPDGTSRWYREDGSVKVIIEHEQGQQRRIQSFWPGGMPKRDDLFQGEDSLVSGRCYAVDGKELEHFPYLMQPEFKGGMEKMYKYLGSELSYPDAAYSNGTQGRVYTQFTVMKDGAIDDAKVLRSVSPELDAEALRVIRRMPAWSPGRMDGDAVKCRFVLPVVFKLKSGR